LAAGLQRHRRRHHPRPGRRAPQMSVGFLAIGAQCYDHITRFRFCD
jgi:hypothetical protein